MCIITQVLLLPESAGGTKYNSRHDTNIKHWNTTRASRGIEQLELVELVLQGRESGSVNSTPVLSSGQS